MFCVAEQSAWTPSDLPGRDADADVETDQVTSTPSDPPRCDADADVENADADVETDQATSTPFDPPGRDADVETDQATSSPSAKLAGVGSVGLKLFYGGRKHPRSAAGQKRKLDIVSDVGRSARARKVPTRYLQ